MSLRVAYVTADPGVPVFGRKGSSVHVQEVLHVLLGRGATVDLFAGAIGGDKPRSLADVAVHPLPRPAAGDPGVREREALAVNDTLPAALEQSGPFDLIYERHSLWSCSAMEYARESGTAGVLEVNSPLIQEQSAYRGLVDRDAAEAAAWRAFTAAPVIVAVSEPVAEYVRHRAPDRVVHVVPNGVDPERFAACAATRAARDDRTYTVGFVGTLRPWHGLPNLVDAFAILHARDPSSRLLVVGDGPERASLEAALEERQLREATRITGAVSPADVPALLAEMDVAVAPYEQRSDFYFSPLKLFEYMAASLPVVASRVGQITDAVKHERTGLLCEPGYPVSLADALLRLRHDRALRRRLGDAARAEVSAHHTWDGVVRRTLTLAGLSAEPVETR